MTQGSDFLHSQISLTYRSTTLRNKQEKKCFNGAESFHSHFNEQFSATHPSLFIFFDVLLKLQSVTYIKIRGITSAAPLRRKEKQKVEYSLDLFHKYELKEFCREEFIPNAGLKFQPFTCV